MFKVGESYNAAYVHDTHRFPPDGTLSTSQNGVNDPDRWFAGQVLVACIWPFFIAMFNISYRNQSINPWKFQLPILRSACMCPVPFLSSQLVVITCGLSCCLALRYPQATAWSIWTPPVVASQERRKDSLTDAVNTVLYGGDSATMQDGWRSILWIVMLLIAGCFQTKIYKIF